MGAVDLRDAGVSTSHLRWMTRVPVYSTVHGLGREYLLNRHSVRLDNPTQTSITLGDTKKPLTDVVNGNTVTSRREYSSLDNRVFALEE